ncbi:MAG: hypothetical protein U5N58_13705 [Actinomycetota bacterium]|nr:hypothetical protein [Actinomycetota bacterium]
MTRLILAWSILPYRVISRHFNVQLIQVQRVVISYLLVIASLLLTWGRL